MNRNSREHMLAKTVSRVALCVAVSTFFVGVAMADPGGLRVTILGPSGAPLAGATVKISSPDSLIAKTAVTDAEGHVRLSGLDPATNYTVEVAATGFENFSAGNVAVVSGKELSVGYALGSADKAEVIVITGTSLAAVDVTSATVGTTLTLDTTEALPTGRSFQSYLQLIPGVKPSATGNPASRSGVNYADVLGAVGQSTDNVYYIDGVNVTDPSTGTFGANFNSEIIQEQQVLVGGIPAEYDGGSGLVSRVTTKSGSNDWHGSVNYYLQNDGLVAKDKHNTSGGFSTYDTAVTIGGPIIQDKIWIFGSYQKKYREDEVLDTTTGAVLRSVNRKDTLGFLKGTWQITEDDRLTATYFNDPAIISGSNNPATLNNRDSAGKQGGDNYKLDYSHTWEDLTVNAYVYKHGGQVSSVAADQSLREAVSFRGPGSTLAGRNLGGAGTTTKTARDRDEFGVNGEYYLDTDFGSHTFKAGYINSVNEYRENQSVPGGAVYTSISNGVTVPANRTFQEYTTTNPAATAWTSRPFVQADIARIITGINASPNVAFFKSILDTNADNTISTAEVNAYTFANTTADPYGNYAAYRALRTISGAYAVQSKGQQVYLQDTWTWNQLTINAGFRAEEWKHYDSTGAQTAKFDWDISPRLSVVYDVFGDARSKVFGFIGRYYDPVRNNMSDFAGALTGPVDAEQIFIGNAGGGQWATFRTRGGATTPDALFSPTTKTPYTDEIMIGGSYTLGSDIGIQASYTHRETRDILEDFDLDVYSNPANTIADIGKAPPGSKYYLPYSYFGYSSLPNSNFVLGTLPGGARDYDGFELTVTKFKTDNWFGQASYTYNDAQGNSNSDSNADFQGDVIYFDPRAPNMYGPQAGNIEHQFKAFGAYDFDFGLQFAGVFNWNSGTLYTPAQNVASRYFPRQVAVSYVDGGVNDFWVLPDQVGSETNPSYYTFDARVKYEYALPFGNLELFLDIFNVLDNQAATSVMPLVAGSGQYAYQQENNWVAPRRFYLGARFSF